MALVLTHVDPKKNMDRFYSIDLTTSLFGEAGIERVWGRRGTFGCRRLDWFESPEEAQSAYIDLINQKFKRGYLRAHRH